MVAETEEMLNNMKASQQIKMQLLRRSFQAEKELTMMNQHKLKAQWFKVLRLAKADQLHDTLEIY